MRYRLITTLPLLFLLFLSFPLQAQPGDDGTLYFPPKLVVEVHPGTWPWNGPSEEGSPPPEVLSELTFRHTFGIAETPLLPMVFFDFGSSDIPGRYLRFYSASATANYVDTGIGWYWSPVTKSRDILNVLGYRMNRYPSTFVELQGSWSFEPGENRELARERAEVVRDYLATIWKIDTGRIRLLPPRQRCRPENNFLLQQEAQSVVINASSWELIRPVGYLDESRWLENFEFTIVVDPNDNPQQVAAIEILARCEDSLVGRAELPGSPDSTLYRFHGAWEHSLSFVRKERTTLVVEAVLWRHDGTTRRSEPIRIPVLLSRDTTDGREISYPSDYNSFSLPFFSPGQTTLSPLQKLLLRERLQKVMVDSLEPDYKYSIAVKGKADISDDPALSDALVRTRHLGYRSALSAYNSFFDDFRGVLRPIRPITPPVSYDDEEDPFERRLDEWYRVWYGNRADDFKDRRETFDSAGYVNVDIETGRMLDTIKAARENEPARLLDSLFKDLLADTVVQRNASRLYPAPEPVDEVLEITEDESISNDYHSDEVSWESWSEEVQTRFDFWYTPEERFYNRTVSISVNVEYNPSPEQLHAMEQERKRSYLEWLKEETGYAGEEWEDIDAFIAHLEEILYGEDEEEYVEEGEEGEETSEHDAEENNDA